MPPKATPTSSGLPTRSSSRLKTSTAPKAPAQPTQPPPTRTRSTRALAASTSGSTPAAGLTSSTKAALKDTKPTAAPIKRVLTARETKPAASNVWVETPSVKSAKDAPNKGKAYDSDREPIKAYLRIRPSPAEAADHVPYLEITSPTTVLMTDRSASTFTRRLTNIKPASSTYTFTRVFPPDVTQADFFKDTTLPLIQDVINGENGLIFAYGATNSGKTFTIQGGIEPGEGGLIPRTLDVLFNTLDKHHSPAKIRPVRLTGIEVDEEVDEDRTRETPLNDEGLDATAMEQENFLAELLGPDTTISTGDDQTKLDVDDDHEYAVFISYVEVYNELVYDLLEEGLTPPSGGVSRSSTLSRTPSTGGSGGGTLRSNAINGLKARAKRLSSMLLPSISMNTVSTPVITRKALALKADPSSPRGARYLDKLREIRVWSSQEAKEVMQMGQINRRVFGTLANKTSSRSHAVFTLKVIKIKKGTDFAKDSAAVQISRLSIVDLAGSERNKDTQTAGVRLKEAGNINKSLMVLGQCMEGLRNNQRRMIRSNETGKVNGIAKKINESGTMPARADRTMVPFYYSKLTELFQDFFEGDGKVAMIVNVNPYDTGFDQNAGVMKFAALTREVATNVATVKAQTGVTVKRPESPTKPNPPPRRVVSIFTDKDGNGPKEALWEVAEEVEDDSETEPRDDLVDQLFALVQELREKLYDAELRVAMAEVEVRQEVTQEYEERIRDMEATFAQRRKNDEEVHEAKMDRKIDLLYQAGVLSGQAASESEGDTDDVDRSLAVAADDTEEEDSGEDLDAPDSPTPLRQPPKPTAAMQERNAFSIPQELSQISQETATEEEVEEDAEEGSLVEQSDGTATDSDWAPATAKKTRTAPAAAASDDDDDEEDDITNHRGSFSALAKGKGKAHSSDDDVVKTSGNKTKKMAPKPVALPEYDLSLDEIPVVHLKKSKKSRALAQEAVEGDEGEDEGASEVKKKKKRQLGMKAVVTEDEITAVAERVAAVDLQLGRGGKAATVRRMAS